MCKHLSIVSELNIQINKKVTACIIYDFETPYGVGKQDLKEKKLSSTSRCSLVQNILLNMAYFVFFTLRINNI